jgi:hypothetical protein
LLRALLKIRFCFVSPESSAAMSEHVRLAAVAGTLFVMSYTGVAWVMAGTPMVGAAQSPVRVAALPASAPSYAMPSRIPAPPRGDGHPQRDKLRLEALQASTAYALTPCDEAAKAVMIAAVSSYAQAWADMMGCGPDGCDYRKINVTAATFSTPLDIQLRDAIGAAFDKRGVSLDDFPSPLRINVAMLVRGRGAPATGCPQRQVRIIR